MSSLSVCRVLAVAVVALSMSSVVLASPTNWDQFQVSWPKFQNFPQTMDAALKDGWVLAGNGCMTNQYFGLRFIRNNDYSAMILYSPRGQLAGIQLGTYHPQTMVYPRGPWGVSYDLQGKEMWTMTGYFREPKTICTGDEYENKIGDGVWIQSGNSTTMYQVPLKESDVTKPNEFWVKGKCFYTMGMHYWANNTESDPCDTLYPVFLLYNKGKLNAFGWAMAHSPPETSPNFEHPAGERVINSFLPADPHYRPKCLYEEGRVQSTMHIYFTRGYLDFC